MEMGKILKPYITDVSLEIDRALREGKSILFEGAQGTHLDVDHGTYPFVTSSNPISGTVCSGAGVGPNRLDHINGVVKAYTTRVGSGPFPTELEDETGEYIQRRGAEFGATTGRRRRCGWLDLVMVRDSVRINGLTSLSITKLDVLTGLDRLKICVGYEIEGKRIDARPASLKRLSQCLPVYEELPGWREDICSARDMGQLPDEARLYVKRIEEIAEVPLSIVSVGSMRDETIILKDLF
jgi:adenylosuccinate synthase